MRTNFKKKFVDFCCNDIEAKSSFLLFATAEKSAAKRLFAFSTFYNHYSQSNALPLAPMATSAARHIAAYYTFMVTSYTSKAARIFLARARVCVYVRILFIYIFIIGCNFLHFFAKARTNCAVCASHLRRLHTKDFAHPNKIEGAVSLRIQAYQ